MREREGPRAFCGGDTPPDSTAFGVDLRLGVCGPVADRHTDEISEPQLPQAKGVPHLLRSLPRSPECPPAWPAPGRQVDSPGPAAPGPDHQPGEPGRLPGLLLPPRSARGGAAGGAGPRAHGAVG